MAIFVSATCLWALWSWCCCGCGCRLSLTRVRQSLEFVGGIIYGPALGFLLNHHPRRVLLLRSSLSTFFTVDAVAYDETRVIQHAKLAGDGDVDTGCTFALRGSGARVFIVVCDPICAVQVRVESFQVAVIESVVLESIDMMTSCMGSSLWLSTASATTPGPNCDLMWNQ